MFVASFGSIRIFIRQKSFASESWHTRISGWWVRPFVAKISPLPRGHQFTVAWYKGNYPKVRLTSYSFAPKIMNYSKIRAANLIICRRVSRYPLSREHHSTELHFSEVRYGNCTAVYNGPPREYSFLGYGHVTAVHAGPPRVYMFL